MNKFIIFINHSDAQLEAADYAMYMVSKGRMHPGDQVEVRSHRHNDVVVCDVVEGGLSHNGYQFATFGE